MKLLHDILGWIAGLAFFGAFIVPDWIAGVNKAMRMGKAAYPKETMKKKWKWVGIFLLTSGVAFGLYSLIGYLMK